MARTPTPPIETGPLFAAALWVLELVPRLVLVLVLVDLVVVAAAVAVAFCLPSQKTSR